MRQVIPAGLLLAACVLIGCGGGGGPAAPPGASPGETVTVGTLQVGVASAVGFKTLPIPSTGQVAFTALYGSEIVRLQEMGYGKLAFARQVLFDSKLLNIWTMNADGTEQTRITNLAGHEVQPSWSPDGSQIVFTHYPESADAEIKVMNADGTGRYALTSNSIDDDSPAWSPDGTRIAYVKRDGDSEICVVDVDGSSREQLTSNTTSDAYPSWSPDGRRIVFSRHDGSDTELMTMNADGTGQEYLNRNTTHDTHPAWSPDGTQIAWARGPGLFEDIWVLNADGTGSPKELVGDTAAETQPRWSPDGRRLTYQRQGTFDSKVWVVNADGTGKTNLSGTADDQDADWCPSPTALRTLIGHGVSDGGSQPPFGASQPLAIVGLRASGLVSAAAVTLSRPDWASLRVAALSEVSTELAGMKITGQGIKAIREDMGRGLPAKVWNLRDSPAVGAALLYFSNETGRITTVIASADVALADGSDPAERAGDRIVLRGAFRGVYDAADPTADLAADGATVVALDARTGRVKAVD